MGLTWQQIMETKSRDDLINICKHKFQMAGLHYNYVNQYCIDDTDYVYQRDTAWDRYTIWHDRLKQLEHIKKSEEFRDDLCEKWMTFLETENLPSHWDAQEAILHDDLTSEQRSFVSEFIKQWEELE